MSLDLISIEWGKIHVNFRASTQKNKISIKRADTLVIFAFVEKYFQSMPFNIRLLNSSKKPRRRMNNEIYRSKKCKNVSN